MRAADQGLRVLPLPLRPLLHRLPELDAELRGELLLEAQHRPPPPVLARVEAQVADEAVDVARAGQQVLPVRPHALPHALQLRHDAGVLEVLQRKGVELLKPRGRNEKTCLSSLKRLCYMRLLLLTHGESPRKHIETCDVMPLALPIAQL